MDMQEEINGLRKLLQASDVEIDQLEETINRLEDELAESRADITKLITKPQPKPTVIRIESPKHITFDKKDQKIAELLNDIESNLTTINTISQRCQKLESQITNLTTEKPKVIGITDPKFIGINRDDPLITKIDEMIALNSKKVGDCLIWTGKIDIHNNPYTYNLTAEHTLQYKIYPKRLAYNTLIRTEPIKNNQRILSICNNHRCVNRNHLEVTNKNSQLLKD